MNITIKLILLFLLTVGVWFKAKSTGEDIIFSKSIEYKKLNYGEMIDSEINSMENQTSEKINDATSLTEGMNLKIQLHEDIDKLRKTIDKQSYIEFEKENPDTIIAYKYIIPSIVSASFILTILYIPYRYKIYKDIKTKKQKAEKICSEQLYTYIYRIKPKSSIQSLEPITIKIQSDSDKKCIKNDQLVLW